MNAPPLTPSMHPLHTVLSAQAELLAVASRRAAARRWMQHLAGALQADSVAVAFVKDTRLHALTTHGAGSGLSPALLAAMHEAWDQRCNLLTPTAPTPSSNTVPPVQAAQQQLLRAAGASSAACVLLGASGQTQAPQGGITGVLCVMRSRPGAATLSAADMQLLQHVAAFAAPVLQLLQQRDRSWRHRMRCWLHGRGLSSLTPRMRQTAWACFGLALAALLLWPATHQVGGPARIEGTVQRLVVAPANGFLKQVHVRPGDTVRQGQLLVELADLDLLAERERWASQLEQAQSNRAEANARADRSQLVLGAAKVAEAQAQLDLVQAQLERTQLLAPFDAVVVRGDLSQKLGAPLELGAELMTLAPAGSYRVVVEVDERDITHVAVGHSGSLALSALPWDTLALRVTRITPMATTSSTEQRNVFEVEAELLAPPLDLRPGLAGVARFQVGQRPLWAGLASTTAPRLRQAWWSWWG
jgi:hypothetical protein